MTNFLLSTLLILVTTGCLKDPKIVTEMQSLHSSHEVIAFFDHPPYQEKFYQSCDSLLNWGNTQIKLSGVDITMEGLDTLIMQKTYNVIQVKASLEIIVSEELDKLHFWVGSEGHLLQMDKFWIDLGSGLLDFEQEFVDDGSSHDEINISFIHNICNESGQHRSFYSLNLDKLENYACQSIEVKFEGSIIYLEESDVLGDFALRVDYKKIGSPNLHGVNNYYLKNNIGYKFES